MTVSLSFCWVILTRDQAEAFPVAADATSAPDHREMYPTPPLTWCTRQKEQARNCNSCKTIICTGFLSESLVAYKASSLCAVLYSVLRCSCGWTLNPRGFLTLIMKASPKEKSWFNMTEITELASCLYPLSIYKLQSLFRAGRRKALQTQEEYSLVGSVLEQTYLICTEH